MCLTMKINIEERNKRIMTMASEGKTAEEIAPLYKLTAKYVQKIIDARQSVLNAPKTDFNELDDKDTEEEATPGKPLKYYTTDEIVKTESNYYVVFSGRSNGKTYATLKRGLKRYLEKGYKMAYIRRWDDEMKPGTGGNCFRNLVANGEIEKMSKGRYNYIHFFSGMYYLARLAPDGSMTRDKEPFCYGFAINVADKYKSSAYPGVRTIIFDEYIARNYLTDEFVRFCNLLSTIIRKGTDLYGNPLPEEDIKEFEVWMLGNVVDTYCPYYEEMGLIHVRAQQEGTIDVYNYAKGLRVAVEYCGAVVEEGKDAPTDRFFAFNNPKMTSITGNAWELPQYPRLPFKYEDDDILMTFIVLFHEKTLKCDVVEAQDCRFIYVQKKTTPIKHPDDELIYSLEYSPKPNYRRSFLHPASVCEQKILRLIDTDKIYFSDNTTGDAFYHFKAELE